MTWMSLVPHPDELWRFYYLVQMTYAPILKWSEWDIEYCEISSNTAAIQRFRSIHYKVSVFSWEKYFSIKIREGARIVTPANWRQCPPGDTPHSFHMATEQRALWPSLSKTEILRIHTMSSQRYNARNAEKRVFVYNLIFIAFIADTPRNVQSMRMSTINSLKLGKITILETVFKCMLSIHL